MIKVFIHQYVEDGDVCKASCNVSFLEKPSESIGVGQLECVDSCGTHYFEYENTKCGICHSTCKNCTGKRGRDLRKS